MTKFIEIIDPCSLKKITININCITKIGFSIDEKSVIIKFSGDDTPLSLEFDSKAEALKSYKDLTYTLCKIENV
jgi:hypothetical protein